MTAAGYVRETVTRWCTLLRAAVRMRVSSVVTFFAILRVVLLDLFLAGFVAICLTLSMDAGEKRGTIFT